MNEDQPQSYAVEDHAAIEAAADARASVGARMRASLFLLIILIGLVWVALSNPLGHSFIPRCPTEQFGGFYCPGCGSTRATHHLLNARLSEALSYNPMLVFIGLPVAVWFLIRTLLFIIKGKRIALPHIPPKAGWAALVVLLAFTVARNLPMPWAEALRPTTVEQDEALFEEKYPDQSMRYQLHYTNRATATNPIRNSTAIPITNTNGIQPGVGSTSLESPKCVFGLGG